MPLLDFILNLAGLLLWLNWRFITLARRDQGPGGISLAGTIKSTASARAPRWPYLAALAALLFIRPLAYYTIGSNLGVSMSLPLGVVTIPFSPRLLARMFLFSWFSFALFVGTFYLWLTLFALLNRRVAAPDACLRLVRLHLGVLHRAPGWFQALVPGLAGAGFWVGVSYILEQVGMLPPQGSSNVRLIRALLAGGHAYLAWVAPLAGVLLLYVVNSYVYLGEAAFWSFVECTGRSTLSCLGRFRIQVGKVDLTPLLLVLVLWFLAFPGRVGRVPGWARVMLDAWTTLR